MIQAVPDFQGFPELQVQRERKEIQVYQAMALKDSLVHLVSLDPLAFLDLRAHPVPGLALLVSQDSLDCLAPEGSRVSQDTKVSEVI